MRKVGGLKLLDTAAIAKADFTHLPSPPPRFAVLHRLRGGNKGGAAAAGGISSWVGPLLPPTVAARLPNEVGGAAEWPPGHIEMIQSTLVSSTAVAEALRVNPGSLKFSKDRRVTSYSYEWRIDHK